MASTDPAALPPQFPGLPVCPDCGGTLDLSQPDELHARRLLGVCTQCRAWSVPASRNARPWAVVRRWPR